jgi:hypothetical protein
VLVLLFAYLEVLSCVQPYMWCSYFTLVSFFVPWRVITATHKLCERVNLQVTCVSRAREQNVPVFAYIYMRVYYMYSILKRRSV